MSDIQSYLIRFKNKTGRKDFELDVWRVTNFIKTNTNMISDGSKTDKTCKLLHELHEEECGEL